MLPARDGGRARAGADADTRRNERRRSTAGSERGAARGGSGALRHEDSVEGVGVGLAIQGLVFFLVDWAVLDRADDCLAVLRNFR